MVRTASGDWHEGTAFAGGEAAMQWGGLWSLPDMQTAWGDDVAVLPFPAIGRHGRPAVPFGAFGACVAASGTNLEAAKDYVRWLWMDREDYQLDFSDSYGTHIPAKPSLEADATKLAAGPGRAAARFVSDHGFASNIMWSGALGDAYATAVGAVLLDGAEPVAAFAEFEAAAGIELALLKG
ncbi:type 2 periplasmic-binding domain-containing protein [Tessaracoccus coleopterorum]|uniref:extracellular solute-binding protein n=1 Tax=Tessaracoccus coleopterorum TaxID=2714950 RepID=UPI001E3F55A2|nr:extracellular solute-binding protein [Tessaracoccus coleopterorum]